MVIIDRKLKKSPEVIESRFPVSSSSCCSATMPPFTSAAMPGIVASGEPGLVGRSDAAKDPQVARRLWEVSEELTGVQFPLAGEARVFPLAGAARLGRKSRG
jgi:hypothetical protein